MFRRLTEWVTILLGCPPTLLIHSHFVRAKVGLPPLLCPRESRPDPVAMVLWRGKKEEPKEISVEEKRREMKRREEKRRQDRRDDKRDAERREEKRRQERREEQRDVARREEKRREERREEQREAARREEKRRQERREDQRGLNKRMGDAEKDKEATRGVRTVEKKSGTSVHVQGSFSARFSFFKSSTQREAKECSGR